MLNLHNMSNDFVEFICKWVDPLWIFRLFLAIPVNASSVNLIRFWEEGTWFKLEKFQLNQSKFVFKIQWFGLVKINHYFFFHCWSVKYSTGRNSTNSEAKSTIFQTRFKNWINKDKKEISTDTDQILNRPMMSFRSKSNSIIYESNDQNI